MAAILVTFIVFTLRLHFLQGAKILTLCFLGGSHYLLMDEVARILQNSGHDVGMFYQIREDTLPGYKQQPSPYPVIAYSLKQQYIRNLKEGSVKYQKKILVNRNDPIYFSSYYDHLSYLCSITLQQSNIFHILKAEHYDIAVVEAFNPCSFLVADKLGLPYIAFYPEIFSNAAHLGLPSPVSYVPASGSHLSDRMDFFERVKNTFMSFFAPFADPIIDSSFSEVIEKNFPLDYRPSLYDLYKKAELWIYNVDFTIEFARPLLPNVQCIGGLLAKPAKPLSQELEDFISTSRDFGFIVVMLGSITLPVNFLKELNDGFAKMPQKIIWRYDMSHWPQGLVIAPNVKLMDWLPQNDLLGHPNVQLLVTHGGLNSLMEAIYHGVPVVGIPLFEVGYDKMVRIEAKNMGKIISLDQLQAERFVKTMQEVMRDERYKKSAMKQSVIRKSQPFPPDQQLVRWVEHIIQSGGGDHLRPYSYQQPIYQRYLLDVALFITGLIVSLLILRIVYNHCEKKVKDWIVSLQKQRRARMSRRDANRQR
ncbi:UDP-glucuronosyltransferase 3A1-like isoform X2 [Eleutherodactylus coqui]|uniref:UDP-glucuronosyltransferase 3A1-like isoform X2 n=1 Tax=Eleutherodactylus coqui TaxID=57060 RepID=UPI0034628C41